MTREKYNHLNDLIEDLCEARIISEKDFCDLCASINALDKREKYRWHDLRKDKTDLPDVEPSKDYLFENKWGQIFKGTFRVVWDHKFFETYIHDKEHGDIYLQCKICNVTRWREIEPFKGE